MSIKTILLAAATAATLAVPAAAMAQDWGHNRGHEARFEGRRYDDRGYRSYGYAYAPAYGYDDYAYRYVAPVFRDDRRWDHDRYDRRDHGRR
jgi:hypothetical protein